MPGPRDLLTSLFGYMKRLMIGAALRASHPGALAGDLEIDTAPSRIKLDVLHRPRRPETQCAGEQRLNANTHCIAPARTFAGYGHVDSPLRDLTT